MSTNNFEPIEISKISSKQLVKYLNSQGLNLDEDHSYFDIFSIIRQFSKVEQEKFLIGFFLRGIKSFPKAEKVAKELVKINNYRYFRIEKTPDYTSLCKLVNQHLDSLGQKEYPIKFIKNDWNEARETIKAAGWTGWRYEELEVANVELINTANDEGQNFSTSEVWAMAYAIVENPARDAAERKGWNKNWTVNKSATDGACDVPKCLARNAGNKLQWIILEDVMPERGYSKGNVFSPLVDISVLGYWPMGLITNPNGKREFNIFIPPIQNQSKLQRKLEKPFMLERNVEVQTII